MPLSWKGGVAPPGRGTDRRDGKGTTGQTLRLLDGVGIGR